MYKYLVFFMLTLLPHQFINSETQSLSSEEFTKDVKSSFEANFTENIYKSYFQQIANFSQSLDNLPLLFKNNLLFKLQRNFIY